MALLFANNANSTLAANLAGSSGATTIQLAPGTGYVFPAPTGGDVFYGTLQSGTTIEIVAVTNRTTDTLTVIRGQDSTSINAFPIGATFDQRVTRADLESFVQSAVSFPVSILDGGTGQTTANTAFNALAPDQTSAAGLFLTSDGANTSWSAVPASGVLSVGAFSGSSRTNGATISGTAITFGPADGTNPGMVTTGADTWHGLKTFSSGISVDPTAGVVFTGTTGPVSITAASRTLTMTAPDYVFVSSELIANSSVGAGNFLSNSIQIVGSNTNPSTLQAGGGGTLLIQNSASDSGAALAFKLNNTVTLATAGAALLSVQNNAVELLNLDIYGNLTLSAPGTGEGSGYVYAQQLANAPYNSPITIVGNVSDGSGAVAVSISSNNTLSTAGAKLLSIVNNIVGEKFYVDYAGSIGTATGIITSSIASGTGFVLNASNTSVSNILQLERGGVPYVTVDASGNTNVYGALSVGGGAGIQLNGGLIYPNAYGPTASTAHVTVEGFATVTSSSSNLGMVINTDATWTGGKILSARNNALEQFYVDYQGNLGVGMQFTYPLYLSGSNSMKCPTVLSGSGSALALLGNQADSGTAIGVEIGTNQTFSTAGSKVVSVTNNSSEVFYIDHAGNVVASGTISGSGGGSVPGGGTSGNLLVSTGGSGSAWSNTVSTTDTNAITFVLSSSTYASHPAVILQGTSGIAYPALQFRFGAEALNIQTQGTSDYVFNKNGEGSSLYLHAGTTGQYIKGYVSNTCDFSLQSYNGSAYVSTLTTVNGTLSLPVGATVGGTLAMGTQTISGNFTASGTLTLSGYTTGIAHLGSGGALTSSLIVDADVDSAAAIAVSKLAAGTNTFVLTTTGGVAGWAAPVSGYITSLTTPTTAQANGMSVTAGALALSLADSTHPGIIGGTSTAQTLVPTFTFTNAATFSAGATMSGTLAMGTQTISGNFTASGAPTVTGTLTLTNGNLTSAATTSPSMTLTSNTANSGTNNGLLVNNTTALTGTTTLAVFQNASVTKFSIDNLGTLRGAPSKPFSLGDTGAGQAGLWLGIASGSETISNYAVLGTATDTYVNTGFYGHLRVANADIVTWNSTNVSFVAAPTITPFNTAGVVHNSAAGVLSSSLIVAADITNNTITASQIANGTITSTQIASPTTTFINALLPSQTGVTSGWVLSTNGTNTAWAAPATGGITQLTSDVTAGPGSGSQAATIAAGAVTLAKMANIASNSIIGNNTASPTTPVALSVANVNTLLGLTNVLTGLTGDVTATASGIATAAATIANGAVTSAKMASGAALSNIGAGNITSTYLASGIIDNILPSQTSNSGKFLTTNGTNSSWATVTSGVTAVGTFSGSSQTNGASISSPTITFGPADGTNPGMVKASGSQTLGATLTITNAATFSGGATMNGTLAMGTQTISGNLTMSGSSLTFSGYGTGLLHSGSGGAITSSLIVAADITNNTITATQIANGTITSTQIASPTTTFINALLPSQTGHTNYVLQTDGTSTLSWVAPVTGGITQLTSDVTAGPGSGSQAATIAAGAVTLAKMANLAANSIIGNNTASPATPVALTASNVNTLLGLTNVLTGTTGDVTSTASGIATAAATIAANAVTYAKFQKAVSNNVVLGNISGTNTNFAELTSANLKTLCGYYTSGDSASFNTLTLSTALSIGNGGTGQTTATAAINALLPSQSGVTSGWVLSTNGTNTAWAAPGAGGGATVGNANVNFGSAPGSNLTSVNVTTSGLVAGSTIWVFMQADTTSDHTATEHILADIKLVAQYVNSTTFTIWAVSPDRLTGQFEVRWAWQ